jgi:hypothetical protein
MSHAFGHWSQIENRALRNCLRVSTRNKRMILTPQEDGTTSVETETIDFPVGTLIEIAFGPEIPVDANALLWARGAIAMSIGAVYTGNISPWWYDIPDCGIDPDEIDAWLEKNPDKLWSAWIDADADVILVNEVVSDQTGEPQ